MTEIVSGAGFAIQTEAIPSLQRAFQQAEQRLQQALSSAQGARLTNYAMSDPQSRQYQRAFNTALAQHTSQLNAFHTQLQQAVQKLGEIAQAYDQHERDTARSMTTARP